MSRKHRWLTLALLLAWSLSHASVRGGVGKEEPKYDNSVEKIRKTLDQTMVLDYTGQSIHDAVEHLKEKTRLNFILDHLALQQMGVLIDPGNPGNPNANPIQVHLKADRHTKVRTALQRMLNAYNLSYVILEDAVLISTEESGLHRQMRQRVSINHKEVPLAKTLKDLAQATALNLVIDPRMAKEAQTPVTLQLDDATLETTVRLLSEVGGMKAVRMGNVLFITSEARAEKIRKEEQQAPIPPNMLNPGYLGGVAGGFGLGGGVVGGVVPLPPPPPATEPAKPDKQPPPQRDPQPAPPEIAPPPVIRPVQRAVPPASDSIGGGRRF
jgi:hypothetical protein